MKKLLCAIAFVLTAASTPARAGIPVIDVANLAQAIQDVIQSIQQIQNQIQQIQQLNQQITQLDQQFASMNGLRGLLSVANNPSLRDYMPTQSMQILRNIDSNGYAGLTGAARASRDAQMVYNCADVVDINQQRACQARLAKPYQTQQFYDDALTRSGSRMTQIEQLRDSASTAADPKAIQEAQARIAVEQAMLQHELAQIELVRAQADAEERVRVSRSIERNSAQASKTGRISDLPW